MDEAIKEIKPLLFQTFVQKWTGDQHTKFCKHKNCSKILNVDGLWKINRMKCMNQDNQVISPELSLVKIAVLRRKEEAIIVNLTKYWSLL